MSPRRRFAVLALALAPLLALGSCAKQHWRESQRLDDLREHQDYVLVHEVAPGETLRSLAELFYGDADRAVDIAARNGLDAAAPLTPGSSLTLDFDADGWSRAQSRQAALDACAAAVADQRAGRLDAAEEGFRRALDLAPEYDDARYDLALVLLKRGRNEQAEALLRDVLKRRPGDPDVRLALGNSLFYQTRFDEAATVLRGLLADDPGNTDAAYALARALTEGGRTDAAIAAWKAYLKLDGTSAWAARAREQLRALGSR